MIRQYVNGEHRPRTESSSNQYFVNVFQNSGTVIAGDKAVMNFATSESCNNHITVLRGTEPEGVINSTTGSRNDHYDSSLRRRLPPNDLGSAGTRKSADRGRNKQKHWRNSKDDDDVSDMSEFKRKKINDRKRMRRQERNSRCVLQGSDDETPDPARVELALKGDDKDSLKRELNKFNRLTKELHPLRDNGRWTEFDGRAQQFLKETNGDPTLESFILLEVSVALNYQNELEQSENMINKAVMAIEKTSGSVRRLLVVLSNCYRADLYRRKKMLGKTAECLKGAREYTSGFPRCLPVAILLYEEGSFKRDFAAIGSNKEPAITEAKELMQDCIDLCACLDPKDVYNGKLPFAISKKAIITLHCETSATRNERIDQNSITEAGESLNTLHPEGNRMEVSEGANIQCLKAQADFYYRNHMYFKAEEIALEGLEIAKNLGFNLEKKPFEERLTDIRQKIMDSPSSGTYRESQNMIDSSSQTNTPVSSENEVELII